MADAMFGRRDGRGAGDAQAGRGARRGQAAHLSASPLGRRGAHASVARDACSSVGLQLSRDPGCWAPCATPFVTVKALLEHNSSPWSEPTVETE